MRKIFRPDYTPARTRVVLIAGLCMLAWPGTILAGIDAQARAMIGAADLRKTVVGLFAVDVGTGRTIVAVNADEPLIPASNMKLITAAAALHLLGPDFTFKTELRIIDASPDAAVLVVKGDGDPAFGDPKLMRLNDLDTESLLDKWVVAAREAGVRRIKALIIDDRVFDRQFVHPDWPVEQLNRWYCAEVAGVNFHDNCLDLFPQPTRKGQAPLVRMLPETDFIEVVNRAVTGNADTFWISRPARLNVMTYRGKVKTKRTHPVHVTVHDPPVFFARLLTERFDKAKVPVDSIRRAAPEDDLPAGRTLSRVVTDLPTVLARCNKDSQNLFAEALIKRMGHQFTGAGGSWDNGAAAVRRFLNEKLGARGAAITIADGSGMSRQNQVSARLLVEVLAAAHRDPQIGPDLFASLSVGGEDGTLRKRFVDGMTGRVHGKSGYINQVSCLSGYIVFDANRSGPPSRIVAFSMLFNGFKHPVNAYSLKQIQNRLVRLIDRTVGPARGYRGPLTGCKPLLAQSCRVSRSDIATRWCLVRKKNWPCETAGVARQVSPRSFVAINWNSGPAFTTAMLPFSAVR